MLEKHLHSRTFLVGNSVTLADIVGACNLYWGYTKVPPHLTDDKPLGFCTGAPLAIQSFWRTFWVATSCAKGFIKAKAKELITLLACHCRASSIMI